MSTLMLVERCPPGVPNWDSPIAYIAIGPRVFQPLVHVTWRTDSIYAAIGLQRFEPQLEGPCVTHPRTLILQKASIQMMKSHQTTPMTSVSVVTVQRQSLTPNTTQQLLRPTFPHTQAAPQEIRRQRGRWDIGASGRGHRWAPRPGWWKSAGIRMQQLPLDASDSAKD